MYTEQTQRIIAAIREIPKGRVDTYGNVALRAGYPRGARQVSRILSSLSQKEALPWHRVINKQGRIALGGYGAEEQVARLEGEGVVVICGKVDLSTYGFASVKSV